MERSTQPKRRSCPTRSRLERSAVQSLVYRRAPDRQSNPIAPRGLVQSIVFAGLGNSALGYRQDATRALRIQSSSLCRMRHSRNRLAVVFAVSPPLIKAGLKFEQIVRNVIHRIPPKVRSGIDGNDKRNGDHKSGAIAESEGLRGTSHSRRQGTIAEGIRYF